MNSVKIFQDDHFYKLYEDYKNNMFIITINKNVGQWIQKNIKGGHELDCEDMYVSDVYIDYVYVVFENEDDAIRFRLRWNAYIMYQPNTFPVVVDTGKDTGKGTVVWLKENVGPQFLTWNTDYRKIRFSFYDKEDAIHFKLRWG